MALRSSGRFNFQYSFTSAQSSQFEYVLLLAERNNGAEVVHSAGCLQLVGISCKLNERMKIERANCLPCEPCCARVRIGRRPHPNVRPIRFRSIALSNLHHPSADSITHSLRRPPAERAERAHGPEQLLSALLRRLSLGHRRACSLARRAARSVCSSETVRSELPARETLTIELTSGCGVHRRA